MGRRLRVAVFAASPVVLLVAVLVLSPAWGAADNAAEDEPFLCATADLGYIPEGSLCVRDGDANLVVSPGPVKPPCERAPAPPGAIASTCVVLEELPATLGSTALLSYRLSDGRAIRVYVAAGGRQWVFGPR